MKAMTKHDNPTHEFNIKEVKGNPYAILGVGKNASNNTIKRAYRGLAAIYHEDVFRGDREIFILIGRAKDCLLNPKIRALYDEFYIFGDIDGKPVKRAAYAQVQKMMIQTVEKAPQLDQTDIKETMIHGVKQGYQQIENGMEKCKTKIKRFEKTISRISGTGKEGNRLIHLLKTDMGLSIKHQQATIAQLKSELLIFDEVLILLENFECTFEQPELRAQGGFSDQTTASSFGM